mgnify:CR=1 FL=1|jgi:hypothetical protein
MVHEKQNPATGPEEATLSADGEVRSPAAEQGQAITMVATAEVAATQAAKPGG